MIFDCQSCCAVAQIVRHTGGEALALQGAGLWVGRVAAGRCTLEGGGVCAQAGAPGDLFLGGGALTLRPLAPCEALCVQLTGLAAQAFLQGLAGPCFVPDAACPGAADLLDRLDDEELPPMRGSLLGYELLCLLGEADEPSRALPPLVAEALALIHSRYMSLYGVEELSEQLAVSKCHLIRTFAAAVGIPPGRYLARTRVEAVKQLLLEGEHDLEAIAALCGFSGADYLCRAFKRETGASPAAWRAANLRLARPQALYAAPRADELYV